MRRTTATAAPSRVVVLLWCACALWSSSVIAADTAWNPLVDAVIERNRVADDVAVAKWHSGAPVHDPVREAALLDAVRTAAGGQALDPAATVAWFEDLLAASRQIQNARLDHWHQHNAVPPGPPPALTELRERLDALQPLLLEALRDQWEATNAPACRPTLTGTADARADALALDPIQRHALALALRRVCQVP